ncbi:MAG TPA: M56 family metallopeptidase, partial [Planctomycetaceae bacterium]
MTESDRLVLLLAGKVTLILGLVAALTLVAGRRWPQNCALWQRLGVLALLILPVAAWSLPAIGIPVLSAPRPTVVDGGPWRAWQVATLFRPNPSALDGRELSASSSRPDADAAASLPRARSSTNMRALVFAAAYCLVAVALAIRFIRAWRGLERLKRASSLVDDPAWQSRLAHWSTVLRIRRPVELRLSDEVSVPMTFGWRVPVILVPGDCISTCDEIQRDAIVIHELTHIARGDFFWQALTRLTAALYWMHPLMWLIRRQDGALCERICDSLCAWRLSRESYGQALVRIAGRKILRPAASLGLAMARPSSLGRRLTDLASCEPSGSSPPNRTQRVIQGATAILVLGLIVVGTLTTRAAARGEKDAAAAKKSNSRKDSANAEPVATIRLPEKIEGEVFDRHDKPVAKANVVISIVSNNKD